MKNCPFVRNNNPYNHTLKDSSKLLIENEQQDQNNLVILKSNPAVYAFLVDALNIPIDNLPTWLWTYTCPENSTTREKELILAIKYTLTDFAGNAIENVLAEQTLNKHSG